MATKKEPKFFPANRPLEFWVPKKEHVLTEHEKEMLHGMKQELDLSAMNIARIQIDLLDKETECDIFRQEMKMSPRLKRAQLQRDLDKKEKYIAGLQKILASWEEREQDVHNAIRALKQFGEQ